MRENFNVALALGLSCSVVSPAVNAGERIVPEWLHEVKIGVLHHDTGGLWSGFNRESGVDVNLEAIFSPDFQVLGGFIRRWQYDHASGLFAGIGLGGAVHNGKLHLEDSDRKALGSRVLFHIPLEVGYRFDGKSALSVYFDHVSNAFLADENEGMDTLGMRYGYRF